MASATRAPTIGKMIDDMKIIAQKRALLSAQDKELKAQQDELEPEPCPEFKGIETQHCKLVSQ